MGGPIGPPENLCSLWLHKIPFLCLIAKILISYSDLASLSSVVALQNTLLPDRLLKSTFCTFITEITEQENLAT